MRRIILGLVFTLGACRASSTAPSVAEHDLKIASVVQLPNDTKVEVVDVTNDSRCPTGVQCAWAGDAAVEFIVGGQHVTLHTNAAAGPTTAAIGGRELRLVSLAPQPEAGKGIPKADYVVKISF